MIIDFKTTGAGWLTFGLTIASFLVKDPATKTTLQQLAGATGAAGLMMAADSKGQSTQTPSVAPTVVQVVPTQAPPTTPEVGHTTTTVVTTEPLVAPHGIAAK